MCISCSWSAFMGNITHSLETGQEISITFTDFNRSHKLVLISPFCFYKLREQTQGSSEISQSEGCLHMWVCGLRFGLYSIFYSIFGLKNVLSLRNWSFIQLPEQSYSCLRPQIKCRFLFISVVQWSFALYIPQIRNIIACQRKLVQWKHKWNKNKQFLIKIWRESRTVCCSMWFPINSPLEHPEAWVLDWSLFCFLILPVPFKEKCLQWSLARKKETNYEF